MVNSEGNTEVDVVVIGLGPGGEAVATQLAEAVSTWWASTSGWSAASARTTGACRAR